MQYQRFGSAIVIRLDQGDEVLTAISTVCTKEEVRLATVSGIGAIDTAVMGIYDVANQAYHRYEKNEDLEILALSGNISEMDGAQYIHIHITVCGMDGLAYGGHLNKAVISGTGEVVLQVIDGVVERRHDPNVGLNLLDFGIQHG